MKLHYLEYSEKYLFSTQPIKFYLVYLIMKYTKRLWRFLIIGCMTWSFEANAETEMAALAKVSDLILAKHPQTDKDKDGRISLAELEAAKKVWVKKFPKLDRDGDGVFSKKESLDFLKMVHQKKRGRGSMKEYNLKPDFSNFACYLTTFSVLDSIKLLT